MKAIEKAKIERLEAIIDSAERFTLVTHTHPDGDAVGCTVGLMNYLMAREKDVRTAYSDSVTENLQFIIDSRCRDKVLFYNEEPEEVCRRLDETEVIFLVDANALERTSGIEDALGGSKAVKVLIDHHLNPDSAEFELVFSETETSSACEFLFYILMEMKDIAGDVLKMPPMTRRALMAGMTTDTNNFANSTHSSTLRMASKLIEAGVDRDDIISELYNSYHEGRLRLMGAFLKDLMHLTPDGVAYAVIDRKTQLRYHMKTGDTEGFVNIPLSIAEVRMSILLKEEEDHFRVSIRSKKGVSAHEAAARYFHGGGHECAAGGKLFFGKDIEGKRPTSAREAEKYIERVTAAYFSGK